MKTTIDLPDDVLQAVKMRAVIQRRPLKDLVAQLLREALDLSARTVPTALAPTLSIGANGIPIMRCDPAAPAARMGIPALLALEQEALAVIEEGNVRTAR
ncbi:MAG: hypothetical protein ACKVQQ_13235 [Burkholderiales bacterium]